MNARVQAVREAYQGGQYVALTPSGTVRIQSLEFMEDDGVEWVEVRTMDGDDPHFRVFNPPTRTAAGDLDPMLALAETVGMYGGAESQRKGRMA